MTTELIGTVYGFENRPSIRQTVAVRCGRKVVRFRTDEMFTPGQQVRVVVERLPEPEVPETITSPEEFLDG